jgi:alpha-D-ribose 1-methylphosphonate 5-triphosphate synthase subunit PhnI
LPELARRIEDLNAVILQRAAEDNTIAVFLVRAGRIEEPRLLRFAELAGEPRSVEQILREWLEGLRRRRAFCATRNPIHRNAFANSRIN